MDDGLEIERKFLPRERPEWLDDCASVAIRQGYLAIAEGESEVRVRLSDDAAFLTAKRGAGEVRREAEIDLPPEQLRALWPLTEGLRVEKLRYLVPHDGLRIEFDVFEGSLEGLLLAEVEFESVDASAEFDPPEWIGDEVTGDARYANESLATRGAPERAPG